MFKHGVFIAVALLLAGQSPAAVAQVLSVPAPAPPMLPAGEPAPADAGRCMWAKLPKALRDEALAQPNAVEASQILIVRLSESDRGEFEASGRQCGVGDQQFASAGRRLAGWTGRAWAEARVAGRWSPEELDGAYRALSDDDKAILTRATRRSGGWAPEERPPFRRYLGGLGVDLSNDDELAGALTYLISRLGDEEDLAAGR